MGWLDALTNTVTEIADSASDAIVADKNASAANRTAQSNVLAANANANASILSSRNLMIAGGVLALAILAVVFIRRK